MGCGSSNSSNQVAEPPPNASEHENQTVQEKVVSAAEEQAEPQPVANSKDGDGGDKMEEPAGGPDKMRKSYIRRMSLGDPTGAAPISPTNGPVQPPARQKSHSRKRMGMHARSPSRGGRSATQDKASSPKHEPTPDPGRKSTRRRGSVLDSDAVDINKDEEDDLDNFTLNDPEEYALSLENTCDEKIEAIGENEEEIIKLLNGMNTQDAESLGMIGGVMKSELWDENLKVILVCFNKLQEWAKMEDHYSWLQKFGPHMDVINLCLNPILAFPDDVKVALLASRSCDLFCTRGGPVIIAQTNKGIHPILSAMRTHSSDVNVMRSCCQLFAHMCQDFTSQFLVGVMGGVDAVARALLDHPQDTELQRAGCDVIQIMSGMMNQHETIINAGGVPALKAAKQRYGISSEVGGIAAVALDSLSYHPDFNKTLAELQQNSSDEEEEEEEKPVDTSSSSSSTGLLLNTQAANDQDEEANHQDEDHEGYIYEFVSSPKGAASAPRVPLGL